MRVSEDEPFITEDKSGANAYIKATVELIRVD
jgi:hypothetical protein